MQNLEQCMLIQVFTTSLFNLAERWNELWIKDRETGGTRESSKKKSENKGGGNLWRENRGSLKVQRA